MKRITGRKACVVACLSEAEEGEYVSCRHHFCLVDRSMWSSRFSCPSALRSGSTVADEVHPRHGYCLLKTTPNTPRVGPEIWADIAIFTRSYGSSFKPSAINYAVSLLFSVRLLVSVNDLISTLARTCPS